MQDAGEVKSLPALPDLPAHHNPVRALGKDGKAQLAAALLSHYESGASMYALAEKLGVHPATCYRVVTAVLPEEWREVSSARYLAEIEDAETELRSASDTIATTRARERLASARWHLERLSRRLYGQDAPANIQVPIQINIGIERTQNAQATAQVIDKTDERG